MNDRHAQSMRELGQALKKHRKMLGLTQQQLAQFAGCAKLFIITLESGKQSIRMDKLLDVLNVLGLQLKLENGKALIEVDGKILHADK